MAKKESYRNVRKANYTQVSNSLLNDKEASLQAKGLLSIFLSNSSDFDINMPNIISRSKNGRDAHYTAVNELIKLGYFARVKVLDEKNRFEEIVYIFSDIKQDVIEELERMNEWAKEENKILKIEYGESKKEPFTESQETDKNPFPENPDVDFPQKESQYINNTKDKNTKDKNTNLEEEEETTPHSELIQFLLSKGITLENAWRFKAKLLEERLEGFTYDQVIETIEWSLERFLEGKCDEPYIYAVGRLKRVLDNKVKEVASKPKKRTGKTKVVPIEKLPDWFDEEKTNVPTDKTTNKDQEQKKQEIEKMLQQLRA